MVVTTYGTLSAICGFPVEAVRIRRSLSTPPESGVVVSRQLSHSVSRNSGRAEVRQWRVRFKDLHADDYGALFDTVGSALPFVWTPPAPDDGAAIECRFLDGVQRERWHSGNLRDLETTIEEVK